MRSKDFIIGLLFGAALLFLLIDRFSDWDPIPFRILGIVVGPALVLLWVLERRGVFPAGHSPVGKAWLIAGVGMTFLALFDWTGVGDGFFFWLTLMATFLAVIVGRFRDWLSWWRD